MGQHLISQQQVYQNTLRNIRKASKKRLQRYAQAENLHPVLRSTASRRLRHRAKGKERS